MAIENLMLKCVGEQPDVLIIVDGNDDICGMLQFVLGRAGYRTMTAENGEKALRLAHSTTPHLAILDSRLQDMTGLELLDRVRVSDPHLPVILLLAGLADLSVAVTAIKAGAFDCLSKPFDNQSVLAKVQEALMCREGAVRVANGSVGLRDRMGPSPAIARTLQDVERVAATDFAVCLHGETGTGKEVIARAIHAMSSHAVHPFVAVDCGSIPDTIIENELFGHERGAFTGAERQQPGKLESAKGGTLFLDEIGNLSWSAQARLLRVLQEREFYRVGGDKPVQIDVRLISASHHDLSEEVARGRFREDLLYRLNDYRISIPPLRARREDILHLARQFLIEANRELGKEVRGFSDEAAQTLLGYRWPGNVRQLRSVVRRAVLLANYLIDINHLGLPESGVNAPRASGPVSVSLKGRSLKEVLRLCMTEMERQILSDALRNARGNKAAVARQLHVDYKTVHSKLRVYGLDA